MIEWIKKQQKSYFLWIGIIVFFLGLYSFVNHLSFERYTIPFILGEESIPFLPWTFVIYLSIFLQYFFVVRRIPEQALWVLVTRFLWVLGISLFIFTIFPTEFPRHLYPGNNFVEFFRKIDGPGNCFPSLHVAQTIFMSACFSCIEKNNMKRILMWIWSLLIIFSVLTTKQHYLIDIFGGIILVAPFILLIKKDLSQVRLN